jgi:hypothetical protein
VLFPVTLDVSILYLVAWAYVILGRPSVFCGASGFSFSCRGLFVMKDEGNLVLMNFWWILQPL